MPAGGVGVGVSEAAGVVVGVEVYKGVIVEGVKIMVTGIAVVVGVEVP